jgi:diguanylate cyclase (GGDEF)-like protein
MHQVVPLRKPPVFPDGRGDWLSRLESIFENAREPVMIYDSRRYGPTEPRIVFANAAYAALFGGSPQAHIGRTPIAVAEQDSEGLTSTSASVVRERDDGRSVSIELSFAPLEDDVGHVTHVIAFCREAEAVSLVKRSGLNDEKRTIAELRRELRNHKRVEKVLLDATCRDGLTGLPNRLLFLELVKEALLDAGRSGTSVSILFLDCDRFKFVNDTFGHLIGDMLLVEIARRLKRCLRPTDILARIGGDEFVVLLVQDDFLGAATSVAQRLSKTFSAPFKLEAEEFYLSASIGVAVSEPGDVIAENLMRDADIAMYQAKSVVGGQRCVAFSPHLRAGLLRRRTLETDLRRALDRSELSIAYQPIVRLADDRLTGFEALARWEHATLGTIAPTEFIAVAEESSLVVELGDWILHGACADLRRWQNHPHNESLSVSVNVSVKQLVDEHFTRHVASALMQSGLRAENLRLEITESSLMIDAELASALLLELRAIGVQSYVDDFGTGYASLTYLQRFPVTTLKIDRSFISGCTEGLANPVIAKTIVGLAQHLGLQVVAEGIETAAQEAALRGLGCDYGQGYYFGKPLPPGAVLDYIADRGGGPLDSRTLSLGGSMISRETPQ